jgi:hypothetical protein
MDKVKYHVVDKDGKILAYSTDYQHLSAIVAQCPSLTILEDSHG